MPRNYVIPDQDPKGFCPGTARHYSPRHLHRTACVAVQVSGAEWEGKVAIKHDIKRDVPVNFPSGFYSETFRVWFSTELLS
jgi:hypothetical protein